MRATSRTIYRGWASTASLHARRHLHTLHTYIHSL